jgi:hypothetical protein
MANTFLVDMSETEELFMLCVGDGIAVDGDGKDAPSCDTTLSGRVLHNFGAYTSGASPEPLFGIPSTAKYAFGMHLADKITSASAPDAFFAWASREIPAHPAILVFMSLDESVLGRCSSVQTIGGIIAITLVDDRLIGFPEDILSMDYTCDLACYSQTVRRFISMQEIADTSRRCDDSNALQAAIRNTSELMAVRVRKVLHEDGLANSPWIYCYPQTCGSFPDVSKLFTHVRGPVEVKYAFDTDGQAAAVRIMGGDVAIHLTRDVNGANIDLLSHFIHATIVFFVHIPEVNDSASTGFHQHQAGNRVDVYVDGVPPSHVIHVIDEAVETIRLWRTETVPTTKLDLKRKLVHILTSACDASAHDRALSARVRTRRLSHALARTLDANLEAIKAHLWRPGGRLVAAMMGRDE